MGIGSRQVGDTRVFHDSDYYLSDDFVNQFADEVKARPTQQKSTEDIEPNIDPDDIDAEEGGDPTDGGLQGPVACADNWKAAAAAERKRMWAIFEESGIFASACRHGMILWIIDMVRCGEL